MDSLQYLARGLIVTTPLSPADADALRADAQVVALADAGDWSGLVEYLSGDSGGRIPRGPVSRAEFLVGALPALGRLAGKDESVRWLWSEVLSTIRAVETIRPDLPAVQGLFALALSQGLLTSAEVEDLRTVPASRASLLLGRAVQLTADDLRAALDVSP